MSRPPSGHTHALGAPQHSETWDGVASGQDFVQGGAGRREPELCSSPLRWHFPGNPFASLNVVLLSCLFPMLFRSSRHPYFLQFQPRGRNPRSPFFSSRFLVHSRKKVLTETGKCHDSKPSRLCFSLGKILLSAQFHTRCQKAHLLHKTSASSMQACQNHFPRTRRGDTGDQM